MLRETGFIVVLLTDADMNELDQAVNSFCNSLSRDDIAQFYFAGHRVEATVPCGGYEVRSNWLIAKEVPTRNSELQRKAIDAINLLRNMEAKRTRFNVMIVDVCRDDALPAGYEFQDVQGLRPMHATNSLVVLRVRTRRTSC